MADIGGSQNAAFGAGQFHTQNQGRMNTNSVTLSPTGSGDDGLAQTSARWASLTPHGVLSSAAAPGLTFEGVQREQGTAQVGAFGKFSDMLGAGSDTFNAGEE